MARHPPPLLFCYFGELNARCYRLVFTIVLHLYSIDHLAVFISPICFPYCSAFTLCLLTGQRFLLHHHGTRPPKASRPTCLRRYPYSPSFRPPLCLRDREGGSTGQERAWTARLQCRHNMGTPEGGHAGMARGPRSYAEAASSCGCGSDQERRNCI